MNALTARISEEISARGVIPFARFMELALYCPEYGYYEKEKDTPGRRGDYFTSVSVGKLYGEILAFQFSEWLNHPAKPSGPLQIAEIGAHNGQLAADILQWLRSHRPGLYGEITYLIVEPSEKHRQWQKNTLSEFSGKVQWVHGANDPGFRAIKGVVFANELLDAIPVHQLRWNADGQAWTEWGVGREGKTFTWKELRETKHPGQTRASSSLTPAAGARSPFAPTVPEELAEVLPDGFTVEVSPLAEALWADLARSLAWGWLLTADYGLEQEEFFSPDRAQGTLRAYRAHHLSPDVLCCPGEQDITAHVNFTRIRATGEQGGLQTTEITTQEKFLIRALGPAWNGGREFGEWTPERTRQFQTLTHPAQLGHVFKVLVQTRNVHPISPRNPFTPPGLASPQAR